MQVVAAPAGRSPARPGALFPQSGDPGEGDSIVRLTALFRSLYGNFRGAAPRRPGRAVAPPKGRRPRLEVLEDRAVPAPLLRLAALGDSLSAAYPAASAWGAGGGQGWTGQRRALRPGKIAITTLAVPGATSQDVLTSQAPQAAAQAAQGRVDAVSLIVGANDVFSHLPILAGAHPETFV